MVSRPDVYVWCHDRQRSGQTLKPRQLVLVVDDDRVIRELTMALLEDEGYEVFVASDAEGALAFLRHHPPSVILLDTVMPGMDGWDLLAAYRRMARPHAPVIVFSGAAGADERAKVAGAAAFLAKPFNLDALLALVSRYARAPAG